MKRILFFLTILLLFPALAHAQKQVVATSPDGQTRVTITLADRIYYDVESHGETLFQHCHIGLKLRDRTLGEKPVLKRKKVQAVSEVITPIHPLKDSRVENRYTLLTLSFAGDYQVEWRVYDDGVAYRFVTTRKGDIEVLEEDGSWQLAVPCKLVLQQPGGFRTSCEEEYVVVASDQWKPADRMSVLPVLVMGDRQKVLLSEFDLFDYPGAFFKADGGSAFSIVHPRAPLSWEDDGDRSQRILKEADYVAKTSGTRTFPWRYMLHHPARWPAGRKRHASAPGSGKCHRHHRLDKSRTDLLGLA